MRIGITGVTGFVGRAMAGACAKAGHEVVGYSRSGGHSIPGVAELRKAGDWAKLDVAGLDALVHLTGEPVFGAWTPAKKKRIRKSRVDVTQALVGRLGEVADADRPPVLVCASATGYYGDRGNELLTEDAMAGAGFLAEVCQAWEGAARSAEALGMRVVRARMGMVIGEGGGAAEMLGRIFRTGLAGRLGSGKQWVSWIDREDLAEMLRMAVEDDTLRGAVNCVSPKPVRNAEMTAILARLVKRPAVIPAPSLAIRVALQGMSEMLLFSQQVDPEVWRERGFTWKRAGFREAMAVALFPEGRPE